MINISYLNSIMGSQKWHQYGRLTQDEASEKVDELENPRVFRGGFILCWSLMSNTIFALLVIVLLARTSSQPTISTANMSGRYSGVGPVQLLQDQRGLTSKVIKTYRFFEDELDGEDFAKGDPYWAALFPCETTSTTASKTYQMATIKS
jgi:hypothetical protein